MSFNFSVFSAGGGGMAGGGSGIQKYANAAALPAVAANADIAITLDTYNLYAFETGLGAWVIIGGPGVAITVSDTNSINSTLTGNVFSADLNIGATGLAANVMQIQNVIVGGSTSGLFSFVGTTTNTFASGTSSGFLSTTDWNTFNNKVGISTIIQTVFPIFGGTNLPASGGITLSMPAANGTTGGYLTATDWNIFNSKMPGVTFFFWVGGSYPTVQSAVNAAELLPQANSATLPSGLCVFVPQGVWGEQVTIRKNVNIMGMAGWGSQIDRLVFAPFNATLCPQNISIVGINTIQESLIFNETSLGSGIFNPNMGLWSIRFQECLLFGISAMNINSLEFQTSKVFGDLLCENVANMGMVNSQCDSNLVYAIDNSLPNLPQGLTTGFNGIYSDHSAFNVFSLETGASSTLQAFHTSFEDAFQDYTAGLSTQVYIQNSPMTVYTDSGTEYLFWQDRSEYMPGATLAWGATVPLFTNDALDLLISGSGITTGNFTYQSYAKGMTLFNKILTLGVADTTNPGLVGTTNQSFLGIKAFDSGLIRLKQTGAGATYLDIGMPSAITGYTLVMPALQGGTFTTFSNQGQGILSFAIPGAYNFYRSVSNSGATILLQERMVEITTGITNQTMNIGYAASGNTGVWFNAMKIDSGLGSVTVQSPDLINGVTNFTWSSQWEAHKFVCNGVGWRVVT